MRWLKTKTAVAATIGLIAGAALMVAYVARAALPVTPTVAGGMGTSTAPGNGKIPIGDANGNYEFVASSTLGAVNSVFGRNGAVTAQSGDYTTSQVTEGSNLYFTNARAQGALSASYPVLDTSGTFSLAFGTSTSNTWGGTQTFTSAPVIAALNGLIAGRSGTLYATATSTLTPSSPLTGSFSIVGTGSLGCQTASGSQAGCLASADWTTFNNKQASIGVTWPITLSGATVGFNGLSTTTNLTPGQVPYVTGANTLGQLSTTTASCAGTASCTAFTVFGSSPITITGSGSSASSTLLNDTNTFSGADTFFKAITASNFFATSTTATSTIADFGGVFDASSFTGSDEGAKVNAAYAQANPYSVITLPSGEVFKYSTSISLSTNGKIVTLDCQGSTLQYTGSGTAITTNTNNYVTEGSGYRNCKFVGPSSSGSTVGLQIGGSNGAFSFTLYNDTETGFGKNINLGDNVSFLTLLHNTDNFGGKLLSANGAGASGENMVIGDTSVFADSNNQAGGASALYAVDLQTSAFVDWNISDTSFDDAQLFVDLFGGIGDIVHCTRCHFEDPDEDETYDFISMLSGQPGVTVDVAQSQFVWDDGSAAPTEFILNGSGVTLSQDEFEEAYDAGTKHPTRIVTNQNTSNTVNWSDVTFKPNDSGTWPAQYMYGTVPLSPTGSGVGSSQPSFFVASSSGSTPGNVGFGSSTPTAQVSIGTSNSGTLTIATSTSGCATFSAIGQLFSTGSPCGTGSGNTFAYPFISSATSSLLTFSGGILATASSTIGSGTQAGGLTISGGATTTGNVVIGTGSTLWTLQPDPNNSNAFSFLSAGMTSPALDITTSGNVGIGSTSPDALVSIMDTQGFASVARHLDFEIGSSSAATTTLFSVDSGGAVNIKGQLGVGENVSIGGETVQSSGPGIFGSSGSNGALKIRNTSAVAWIEQFTNSNDVTFGPNSSGADNYIIANNSNNSSVNVGLGSTTPMAKLSVQANAFDTNQTLFAIGSSTLNSTTTLFSISNTGAIQTAMTGTNCVQEINGLLSGTGSACGSGSGGIQVPSWTVAASGGNYTTIQAALNQCGAVGGGSIYLLDASYSQGSTGLTFKGSNCSVYGRGYGTTTINFTGATTGFKTNLASGDYSHDGVYNVVLLGDGTTGSVAIDLSNMSHNVYENIQTDNWDTTYKFNDTQNVTFYNKILNTDNTTIKSFGINASSTDPANDNTIENSFFGCSNNTGCVGANFNNAQANTLNQVTFEPAGNSKTTCIQFRSNNLATNNGTFSNNLYQVYCEGNQMGIMASSTDNRGGNAPVFGNNFYGGQIETNTTEYACDSADCSEIGFYGTGVAFANKNQMAPLTIIGKNLGTLLNISDQGASSMAALIQNNTNFAHTSLDDVKLALLNGSDTSNLLNLSNAGTGATIIATSTRGTDFILTGGKTGMGTSSPTAQFDVEMNANTNPVIANFANYNNGANAGSVIAVQNDIDASISLGQFSSGNTGTETSYGGTFSLAGMSRIRSSLTTNGLVLDAGGSHPMIFLTNDSEAGRILSTGQWGIGTTSPFARLSVFANNGETNRTLFAVGSSTQSATTTLFSISNTGSTTLGMFGTCGSANALQTNSAGTIICGAVSSDPRLKENIAPLAGTLSLVKQLQPISFNYKPAAGLGSQQEYGFNAKEVEALFPDAVEVMAPTPLTPDGTLEIKEPDLVAVLWQGVLEQQAEIEELGNNSPLQAPMRSAEENYQWIAIGLLGLYAAYNEWDKRRRK
jgi:hypothetical protein